MAGACFVNRMAVHARKFKQRALAALVRPCDPLGRLSPSLHTFGHSEEPAGLLAGTRPVVFFRGVEAQTPPVSVRMMLPFSTRIE